MTLRADVVAQLRAHGVSPQPGEPAAALRERLNEEYLVEVRRLKARQKAGEIPIAEYAGHARALQQRFPLLGLPIALWESAG